MRFSSARVKICQISCVNFETTRRFLSKFCIPLRCHEGLLLCSVLVRTISTLLNRSPLKWSFLRFSSVWVKFWEIPDGFWNEELILLQILYLLSVSWKIIPQYLFSSKNIYFHQKEPIKMKIFEIFECSGQNLSNFLCQFWNGTLIPLQILYPSSVLWKVIPVIFFSSNNIYFAQ